MSAQHEPPSARILIVDDEPLNIDYLEQELECHGFVVDTATNGIEALERVASAPPDLILLDVMMPELDGIGALRILKGDPETRLIPVVLMTALNAVEDRVRGIEAGADDFLTKPVDDRELLARIRTALALKRTIDETVDELRGATAHLEQYGRRVRDVAILVVRWRQVEESLPAATVAFLGRREREEAETLVAAGGGVTGDSAADRLIAVFEGADDRTRAGAAADVALAILAHCTRETGAGRLAVGAAIATGQASVGSTRGDAGWVYAAEGGPVDEAAELVGAAQDGQLVAGTAAAKLLADRFTVVAAGDGAQLMLPVDKPAPAPRASAYPAGLTAREIDILRLVAVGLSDAEVAGHLFLSVRTVNAHLRSIYRKLGVRSRAAAGRYAEEHGLV
jgi:DNA-binding NarL/FixJ family response regulator